MIQRILSKYCSIYVSEDSNSQMVKSNSSWNSEVWIIYVISDLGFWNWDTYFFFNFGWLGASDALPE